jgi:hypothetical protein
MEGRIFMKNALDTLLFECEEETVKIGTVTTPLATTPPPPPPPQYFLFVTYSIENAPLVVFNGWLRGIGCPEHQLSEAQDNNEMRWLIIDHLRAQGIPVPVYTREEMEATFAALEGYDEQ